MFQYHQVFVEILVVNFKPSVGGQGIASGFRDAAALAWRLEVACKKLPRAYPALFEAWYKERKQQLEHSLAATVENGNYVTEGNPIRVFMRDILFTLIQLVPSWKRGLERGARTEGMCYYAHQRGLHFLKSSGGLLLPQIYCRSLFPDNPSIQFTDDVIFASHKRGLFQLVVIVEAVEEIEENSRQLSSLDIYELSSGFMEQSESTIIVHDLEVSLEGMKSTGHETINVTAVRIASKAEFASSALCENRPEPRYYDPHRITKETRGRKFLVVRPDRFTFATCANIYDLREALKAIKPVLSGEATAASPRL